MELEEEASVTLMKEKLHLWPLLFDSLHPVNTKECIELVYLCHMKLADVSLMLKLLLSGLSELLCFLSFGVDLDQEHIALSFRKENSQPKTQT